MGVSGDWFETGIEEIPVEAIPEFVLILAYRTIKQLSQVPKYRTVKQRFF